MVLTAVRIENVTPRGGGAGIDVTVEGVGFGVNLGSVLFDPLGSLGGPFAATVLSWQDDEVRYTTPTELGLASRANQFHTVLIQKPGATDHGVHRWWVQDQALFYAPPPTSIGLDYQWPAFEEGTPWEDDDDPRLWQAADFNRLLDQHLALWERVDDLVVGAAILPWVDLFTPTTGQTVFVLSKVPSDPSLVEMQVNGVGATYGLHYNIVGQTLTWASPYSLQAPNDRVRVTYFYSP